MIKNIKIWFHRNLFCSHEKWIMDKQINTIECEKCGKRAYVKEYKSLYK